MKYLITDYKKIVLYGDTHIESDGWFRPFRGRAIRVKILGIFWVTYRHYTVTH